VALLAGGYAWRRSRLLSFDPRTYEQTVSTFYRALASLQVGLLDDARTGFAKVTELVPREPAGWANLALSEIRLGDFDAALRSVQQAGALDPRSSEIEFLFGQLETSRGRLDEGIGHFRRAIALDARALRPRGALAQELERAGGADGDSRAQEVNEELLALVPGNLVVLIDRARLAAKRGDKTLLQDSVSRLAAVQSGWPAIAVEQYRALQQAAAAGNAADAARATLLLRNVLVRAPAFRDALAQIRVPSELIADPFMRFVRLPSPAAKPDPDDDRLSYSMEPFESARSTAWGTVLAASVDGTSAPVVFAADAREIRRLGSNGWTLPLPGGASTVVPSHAVLALDWNRDFRMDLAIAGSGGLRLLLQRADGTFADGTADASRASAPITAACDGVWTADIEMDGDLDLVVGVHAAAPIVLRNNGDGTWRSMQPFAGITGLRDFLWADLDGDGAPDAVMLDDQGAVHVFENRQAGEFRAVPGPGAAGVIALAAGDVNGDGVLDLVTLDSRGAVKRASIGPNGWTGGWIEQQIAGWDNLPPGQSAGSGHLLLADLDNNGALDVVASASGAARIWLGDGSGFRPLASEVAADVFGAVDLDGDGLLDLIGLSTGQAVRLSGRGTKAYHWQLVRTRAQPTAGDQRINSFGVGGEIEIRSGLLIQKQTIAGGLVHFGLGSRTGVEVTRIVWPNGVLQADFDGKVDEVVVSEQRLKGSCPWVFADSGSGMQFVTDFLWRSPLGLRVNAQDTAGVTQTEDWVKIRGDQLASRDGMYDVRITAELWETHFVDHVSLAVVDHPADVDVFVDERLARETPRLAVQAMRTPRAVAHAWDEHGTDVTELVSHQDGRYLATFALGPYQGVAEDHYVDLELGREIPPDGRLWLVANGWIYPTDSSINVAIAQGSQPRPRGLSLEAQDDAGRWILVDSDLGFPAGKNKTVLLDLSHVVRAGVKHGRRVRLRTNLEVYWDWLAVAEPAGDDVFRTNRLQPARADLRYRGYSQTRVSGHSAPEVPIYDKIGNVTERWRDLVGYYTRFGDVRELLEAVDDRYVIMNAGDELRLLFPAAPPVSGWTRDFVLIGDGWVKDGDFNTSFSKTVLPLPAHDHPNYEAASAASEVEDDPVFRRHPQDWQNFHTRFVSPDAFLRGLRQ
jgi:tetratricopeptide (TPR) repeat protein